MRNADECPAGGHAAGTQSTHIAFIYGCGDPMTCNLWERPLLGTLRKATRDRAAQRTGLLSNDRTLLTTKHYFYPHCQPPRGPANCSRKTDPQRREGRKGVSIPEAGPESPLCGSGRRGGGYGPADAGLR